jgi:hypothetical protein
MPRTYTDWVDIEGAAEQLAGNHRRFESFGWHERPDDDENWCIVYVSNRDSGLLDQSNADAIGKLMEPFLDGDDVRSESHGHWACGYVDGYSIRVYRPDGTITEAFRAWCGIQERQADYPVLDEEDYSRREYEATLENIRDAGRRYVSDDAPEDWECEAFSWFWDNNQRAVENRDDTGGYPSEIEIRECLSDLGWLEGEE